MANPYRELLITPGVMGLVLVSSIARLPQAMIGIGILTMLVQQTGLYWLAGWLGRRHIYVSECAYRSASIETC